MFRKLAAVMVMGIFGAVASSSMADSVVATLGSPGPAIATANINGSGDFYAGVLNWSVVATTPGSILATTSNFGTYCIDITDDIGVGGTYEFNLTSLGSDSKLGGTYNYGSGTVSMVAAIETFYSDYYATSLTSNEEAGAFQGALWTILFTPPTTIGLNDSTATGIENSELSALNAQLAGGQTLDNYSVMALVANPNGPIPGYPAQGQDQALVVVPTFGSAPVPLPSTSMGGCVLLGLFGLGAIAKKMRASAAS